MKQNSKCKRVLAGALIISILCAATAMPISASDVSSKDELRGVYAARYQGLSRLGAELSISSGSATCTGTATTVSGYTCDVTLRLQRYTNSKWKNVKTWTLSGKTNRFNETYYVTSGYEYRLEITADVYHSGGTLVDTATVYSNQVNY